MVVTKIKITAMILTCMLYNALNTCARSVDISHKGCKYSIDLPSGWDTIPHDTLKRYFHGLISTWDYIRYLKRNILPEITLWLVLCLFCSPSIHILSTGSFRT